jgi:hypothetical protein
MREIVLRNPKLLLLMVLVIAIGNVMYHAERWIPAMNRNVFASDTIPAKPLIEAQLPKQVTTATFAMG